MEALGIRNNNPLNIRYSPMNHWKGQDGSCRSFCRFTSLEFGYRAALILLRNYVKRGHDCIAAIIGRWAPASENDTQAYIDVVMRHFNGYADPCYKRLHSTDRLPSDNLEDLLPYLFELAWIMSLYECGALHKPAVRNNVLWPAWDSACKDFYKEFVR